MRNGASQWETTWLKDTLNKWQGKWYGAATKRITVMVKTDSVTQQTSWAAHELWNQGWGWNIRKLGELQKGCNGTQGTFQWGFWNKTYIRGKWMSHCSWTLVVSGVNAGWKSQVCVLFVPTCQIGCCLRFWQGPGVVGWRGGVVGWGSDAA